MEQLSLLDKPVLDAVLFVLFRFESGLKGLKVHFLLLAGKLCLIVLFLELLNFFNELLFHLIDLCGEGCLQVLVFLFPFGDSVFKF